MDDLEQDEDSQPIESRQVRRARERADRKGQVSTDRQVTAIGHTMSRIQKTTRREYYSAPRWQEGSPPPHPEAHPGRYPCHHDPDKGQVYDGECNTTACDRRGAVHWNMGTYALYCNECARGQNFQRDRPPLTIHVLDRPHSIEEMAQLRIDNHYDKIF